VRGWRCACNEQVLSERAKHMPHLHVVYDQAQPGFRVQPIARDTDVPAIQLATLDEVVALTRATHLAVYTEYPGLWFQLQERGVPLINADPLDSGP
jgi:hypothetical protein